LVSFFLFFSSLPERFRRAGVFSGGFFMGTNEIVKKFDVGEEQIETQIREAMEGRDPQELKEIYEESIHDFEPNTIIRGKVVSISDGDVIVNVGYKSEGIIPIDQFGEPPRVEVGDEIEVFLESVEDESGMIVLSKRKADRIRAWERVISTYKEGDTVTCRVLRKIKGGLLVDIGVPVFLPASQVGIRRAPDISEYIGRELECKIIKIDEPRMNIVVSRRRLEEEMREEAKNALFTELEVGQIRKGVVKNIADFGAFVDLGGVDGLLHITDMSWGRISHPSEMVAIDDEIEVKVLKIDRERERISLGLKQRTPSPWVDVEKKYPVSSKVTGRIVNILSYGAFVKLEDGIEGLVHISEMSWTKRLNHPSELVAIGDIVEVVVLDINKEREEISLGMKQVEINPWTLVQEKYPPGTIIEGRVRNLTNYGVFIELEEGIDGLLHISDMSWTRKISHPQEVVKKGDKIRAVVLTVDQEKKRVALGMKQLTEDPWKTTIVTKYRRGNHAFGKVTNVTNFGIFVKLESDLEGLLHISEVGKGAAKPEVKVGEDIEVKVVKLDPVERKIGLTLERILTPEEVEAVAQKKLEPLQAEVQPEPAAQAPAKPAEVAPEEPEKVPSAPPSVLAAQLAALQERKAREAAERAKAQLQPQAQPEAQPETEMKAQVQQAEEKEAEPGPTQPEAQPEPEPVALSQQTEQKQAEPASAQPEAPPETEPVALTQQTEQKEPEPPPLQPETPSLATEQQSTEDQIEPETLPEVLGEETRTEEKPDSAQSTAL
jgi:small subunit ribosomal protein S1